MPGDVIGPAYRDGMSYAVDFAEVSTMMIAAILVMEFVGPVAVQAGLRFAGETAPDDDVGTTTGRHVARVPGAEANP